MVVHDAYTWGFAVHIAHIHGDQKHVKHTFLLGTTWKCDLRRKKWVFWSHFFQFSLAKHVHLRFPFPPDSNLENSANGGATLESGGEGGGQFCMLLRIQICTSHSLKSHSIIIPNSFVHPFCHFHIIPDSSRISMGCNRAIHRATYRIDVQDWS